MSTRSFGILQGYEDMGSPMTPAEVLADAAWRQCGKASGALCFLCAVELADNAIAAERARLTKAGLLKVCGVMFQTIGGDTHACERLSGLLHAGPHTAALRDGPRGGS